MTGPEPGHDPIPITGAPPWQEVHQRFQRGLVHRGAHYEQAGSGPAAWRDGPVVILRPAGPEAQRLWILMPLHLLAAPERISEGVLADDADEAVLAAAADALPPAEEVAELEARAHLPLVIFSPEGVVAGPRGQEPGRELRATLAYDDATLAAVDVERAFARIDELDAEREFYGRLREDMPRTWLNALICALLVGLWLLQKSAGLRTEVPSLHAMLAWGACQGGLIEDQPWRLLTAGFLHFGLLHLAVNTANLVVIGGISERLFGRVTHGALFLLTVVGGFLASCTWNPAVLGVGASGGVFGVIGAIAAYALRRRAELPRRVFLRLGGVAGGLIVLNLLLTVWLSVTLPIDNAGHMGGLLVGLLGGWLLAPSGRPGRLPSEGQLLVIAGLTLALTGAYYTVRDLPAVDYQRTLWKTGVSDLELRLEDTIQDLGLLQQNHEVDRAHIAAFLERTTRVRKGAALLRKTAAPPRPLGAVVDLAEALDAYLHVYRFKSDGTLTRVPDDEQDQKLLDAATAARAAQQLDD